MDSQAPVTRAMLCLAGALTLLVSVDYLSPLTLHLDWELVTADGDYWRPVTCFFFVGTFGLHSLWNLSVFYQYIHHLESEVYLGNAPEFLWNVLLIMAGLLVLSLSLSETPMFLAMPLLESLIYIWSRTSPDTDVLLFMIIQTKAAYLPWILVGLSMVFGSGMLNDHLQGMLIGHMIFFCNFVYPKMPSSGGRKILAAPRAFRTVVQRLRLL